MNNINLEQLGKSLERGYIKFDIVIIDSRIVDRMKLQKIDYLIRRLEYVGIK